MKVLGISGSERHGAAALTIDGIVVAAAAEESFARIPHVGYRFTGGFPHASVEACLSRAGLDGSAIDRVVVVDDASAATGVFGDIPACDASRGVQTLPRESIAPALADARQVGAVARDEDLPVLVVGDGCLQSVCFRRRGGELAESGEGALLRPLLEATSQMAQACGLGRSTRYRDVEQLGSQWHGDDPRQFDDAIGWDPARGIVVDEAKFARALVPLSAAVDPVERAVNVRGQQERQAAAWSFCSRAAAMVSTAIEHVRTLAPGSTRVGLAGSLFGSPGLLAVLKSAFGDGVVVAPVPEPVGRAMGAALDRPKGSAIASLALGPDYSEPDIKLALENCRLDYLYEPDWDRLLSRVSRLLARGSVVGWFQGAAAFGPRSLGTRSTLCDPSNRYARENMNRFLRKVPLDEPLPVMMTPAAAARCLSPHSTSSFHIVDARIGADWNDKLRAGVGRPLTVPVSVVTAEQSPITTRLLEYHERTGVPGLINTPLCGPNEPAACTPRDAIRTVFSSAIDALVVGRFLLMKDYWLLRSSAESEEAV
ncbi:MAG TPA: carbamoyltransferase C-terminal domain-containing protein [Vicinamibacterales bacterium]|nr:carbamoyltransferase C-terminal domain-containing protein [Vicinamibacterales bacterium]